MIEKRKVDKYNFTVTCKAGSTRFGLNDDDIIIWYETGNDVIKVEIIPTGVAPTLPNFVTTLSRYTDYHIYTTENHLVGEQSSFQPEPVSEPPYNGIVFNYVKQNGTTRLVRLNHMQFMVVNGKQAVMGYDADRKAMRTFYWDQVINFPPCE